MTDHVPRLYLLAVTVLVFFVAWAAVAARPWSTATSTASLDPRIRALLVKQQRVRAEAVAAGRALEARRQQASAAPTATSPAPSVRVVTLPPLTMTRTS
jgi:hypothetical protein